MKVLTKLKLIGAFSAIPFGIMSCFKGEEFPLNPVISDPLVVIHGDSATLTFSFTDGDADLGLTPADTFGVHAPNSYYYNNIYLDYFEKDDALGWVRGLDLEGDTIRFAYRIKPIEVSENTKGIKGTIDVAMQNFANPFSPQSDTIKFEIRLIDRALNVSNVIETNEIISQ